LQLVFFAFSEFEPVLTSFLLRRRRNRTFGTLRRALTLIELVVVMVILAAVAGIVLPLLPNMTTRAHTSTSATNIGEVAKAIQTHETVYLAYPNNFDSLVTGTSGALAAYIPGNTGFDLTTVATTTATLAALNSAGITTMQQMIDVPTTPGDFSPTFFPYGTDKTAQTGTTGMTPITSGATLASITGAAANRLFAAPLTASYAVFGVGTRTTMQGKTLQESPVHFSDEATGAPNLAYCRYGVVFQLTDAAGAALSKARMIGIIAFHSDGVVSMNDHLAEYWQANKN
jgi:prepilin-type N-terminal cleavage/methylation domain-containing protein